MERIPALEFIPQRQPMVMVDDLLYCDDVTTRTEFTIREDNLFVENGVMKECGLLEIIAQTCATRIGYLNINEPVKIGVIGAVKNFIVNAVPAIGDVVQTEIIVGSQVLSAVIVNAKVFCRENIIAECEMKVFVIG